MFPKGQGGKILQIRKLKLCGSQRIMPKVTQLMRVGLGSATEPAVFMLTLGEVSVHDRCFRLLCALRPSVSG